MSYSFRERVYDGAVSLGVVALLVGLVAFPSELTAAARDGVDVAFRVMLPSLFPFFVVSELAVRLGLADGLGKLLAPVMRRLFNVSGSGAAAVVLGFVGGYPVGAKTVIGLYRSGDISKVEAERLLSFSNNSGPAFILGVVGSAVFSSRRTGLALYLIHALSSLLVGIVFRFRGGGSSEKSEAPVRRREPVSTALVGSISGGFGSALGIAGYIVFFTVLVRLLFLSGAMGAVASLLGRFGVAEQTTEELVTGFLELTGGVWSLRGAAGAMSSRVAMAAFMLGWAGVSVHCQVLSFLSGTGLSSFTYIAGKLLHGLISAALTLALAGLFPEYAEVSLTLAEEVEGLAAISFWDAFAVSLASAAILAATFAATREKV